jgi:glycerophosphoryl diester phosphodiesterase
MAERASTIFSHRGICDVNSVGNSKAALEKASKMGFSIETDIRLFANQLVVSHDAELSTLRLWRFHSVFFPYWGYIFFFGTGRRAMPVHLSIFPK